MSTARRVLTALLAALLALPFLARAWPPLRNLGDPSADGAWWAYLLTGLLTAAPGAALLAAAAWSLRRAGTRRPVPTVEGRDAPR